MTGQVHFDSYADTGVVIAVDLVNQFTPPPSTGVFAALQEMLAIDPPSVAQLRKRDAAGFLALAQRLREVFDDLHRGDVDAAAARLNELLADHPAQPHLAIEDGQWRLHHHPVNAALVPMWTSICAEAMARMIGAGHSERFGTCDANDCDRVFFDVSKNASRRFCSTTCQNRMKAAAYRGRQASGNP